MAGADCAEYNGWVAAGRGDVCTVTGSITRLYLRENMWCKVVLQPPRDWRGEQPACEIRRQLDQAVLDLIEAKRSREYARMC